jgi:superoxide reductase
MKELKFYKCRHCGNVVWKTYDSGVDIVCCGEKMEQLTPGSVDASKEKHVPVITNDGGKFTVRVGSVTHPMEEKHYIVFIALVTGDNITFRMLKPGDAPELTAEGTGGAVAYEYCNLHGLWKAEV